MIIKKQSQSEILNKKYENGEARFNPLYRKRNFQEYFQPSFMRTRKYVSVPIKKQSDQKPLQPNKFLSDSLYLQKEVSRSKKLRRKMKTLTDYQDITYSHFQKVMNIQDSNPGSLSQRQAFHLRQRSSQTKTDSPNKKTKRENNYRKHIRDYINQEEKWTRYGYTYEIHDDKEILNSHIISKNKELRNISKSYGRSYHPPIFLPKKTNKKIVQDSKKYMQKSSEERKNNKTTFSINR